MTRNSEILNELMSISPLVAGIPPHADLYRVPSGYFDGLPTAITSQVLLTADPTTLLQNIDKKPVFTVPSGYFEGFAARMLQLVKAGEASSPEEELKTLSPLLSSIAKKSPFTLPADYFNDLSENVIAGVAALQVVNDELENLGPLMNDLKNKNVYTVPDGYFDQLPGRVLNNVKGQTKQRATVISMGKGRKWMRYAAAAVVAGILITVGSVLLNKPAVTSDPLTTSLAKLSDQEILNYIDNHNTAFADSLNTVATADISINDASDLLSDVSDDELEQYADNNGVAKDDAMN